MIPVLSKRSTLELQSAVLISYRIIEPPPNYGRPTGRETPIGVARLNDNTGQVRTGTRPHPTAIRTSSLSSPKHGHHDWLMNDSD